MTTETAVLVLAAGKGTRMKSDLIKVLHPLMGQPMLAHVLNSARYLNPAKIVVVVGHQADRVKEAFSDSGIDFCLQTEQLGTGHAVASASESFKEFKGTVLILSGDVPLLSPQTMSDFLEAHRRLEVILSVLTVALPDPGMYGRAIRDEDGYLQRIVEARDARPEELAVGEINSGIYAVDSEFLFDTVGKLGTDNDQGEFYLTDIVGLARSKGDLAAAVMCPDPYEVLGINDRAEMAHAVQHLRDRTNQAWMTAGVTMIDPPSVYIETMVKLSRDVTLWPGVCIQGRTVIGPGAEIGPGCQLINAEVGAWAKVLAGSYIENSSVPEGETVAPSTVIRPE